MATNKKRIRYVGQGIMRVQGAESARVYVFHGNGAIVSVMAEDYEALLAVSTKGTPCCGQPPFDRTLFAKP